MFVALPFKARSEETEGFVCVCPVCVVERVLCTVEDPMFVVLYPFNTLFKADFVVAPCVGKVNCKPFCAVFAEGNAVCKLKQTFLPVCALRVYLSTRV